ncbi:MAG: hypothetical protein DMG09_05425 [Acidobacteria bacterium]|nr:MAG: hypothetical protein DMG09_05425 [Acidobacteriota bacterium]
MRLCHALLLNRKSPASWQGFPSAFSERGGSSSWAARIFKLEGAFAIRSRHGREQLDKGSLGLRRTRAVLLRGIEAFLEAIVVDPKRVRDPPWSMLPRQFCCGSPEGLREYANRAYASAATPGDDGGLLQARRKRMVLRLAFSISSAVLLAPWR